MTASASEQSNRRTSAPPRSRTGSPSHASGSQIELPESLRTVLSQNEVTPDVLRSSFEELLRLTDQRYEFYLDQAMESVIEHCIAELRQVIDKRMDEFTDTIEQIRTTAVTIEQRLNELEGRINRMPEGNRPLGREPKTPIIEPPEPYIRPFRLPPTPEQAPLRTTIQRPLDAHDEHERINPAVFRTGPLNELKRDNELAPGVPTASLWHFGPIEPGVEPLTTLLPEFRRVIDYRSYRLQNTSALDNQATVYKGSASKIVTRMRSLMPRLTNFDGRTPIALLRFLRDIRQAFDGVRLSEGAAVRTISWFLEGDALQSYSSRAFSGIRRTIDTNVTWSYVINTLIERYLSDDILSDAFTKVTTAVQNVDKNEDENAFLTRIERYADDCCGVFDDYLLVSYFLRGLSGAIRPTVSYRVHKLTATRRSNLNVVRRLAQSEGDAYRARLNRTSDGPPPSRPSNRRSSASTESTMLIDQRRPLAINTDGTPPLVAPVMPEGTLATSHSSTTNETIDATIDATIQKRIETFLPSRLPTLSKDQTAMAHSMIPKDSDAHVCWLCRLDGHTLYTCPYLTEAQRLYSAYQNYRYQLETRPHMRNLLEQRAQEHIDAASGKPKEPKQAKPKMPQRRGPSYGSAGRTILRRDDSQRQPNLPKNVLDAVMTLQAHTQSASGNTITDLLSQLGTIDKPTIATDPPVDDQHVKFAPDGKEGERRPSPSTSDSDSSKND